MSEECSSDMNKPCWKLAKACPQSQKLFCFGENNLPVMLPSFIVLVMKSSSLIKTRKYHDGEFWPFPVDILLG